MKEHLNLTLCTGYFVDTFFFQVIDSKKKNFQHEDDSGFLRQQGAINNANYGNTRKTLGTRYVKSFLSLKK